MNCYVAAPSGSNWIPILATLKAKNISVLRGNDSASSVFAVEVKAEIAAADFVCIFAPEPAPPANLWFEIGLAIGMAKPIFIVAAQQFVPAFPGTPQSFVRALRWSSEIIEPHLDAFLQTLPKRSLPPTSESRRKPPSRRLAAEREELRLLPAKNAGSQLEDLIISAFRKARFTVQRTALQQFGADLVVTSPAVLRELNGPIFVEIRSSIFNPRDELRVEKLVEVVRNGLGAAGIYVAGAQIDRSLAALKSVGRLGVTVLLLSAEELLDLLDFGSLIEKLKDVRTQTGASKK